MWIGLMLVMVEVMGSPTGRLLRDSGRCSPGASHHRSAKADNKTRHDRDSGVDSV